MNRSKGDGILASVKSKTAAAVFWIFSAALMAAIFFLSAQNAQESVEVSSGLLVKLLAWLPFTISENFLRDSAHAAEYFVLAALLFFSFRYTFGRNKPLSAFLCAAVYSITDELHQHFVPGRACQLYDLMIDALGAAAALLCFTAFFYARERRRLRCGIKRKAPR